VTAPSRPVVRQQPHRRPKKKAKAKANAKAKATPPRSPTKTAKPAKPPPAVLSPTGLTVSKAGSSSSSTVVSLALGLTFVLSLVLAGLGLVPFRRLPRAAQAIAYDRREPLLYTGIVIYITTGVSLVIALLMS
jgi:hypothetical protein